MRHQPWSDTEWNDVRDEARELIATARRLLQQADGETGETLKDAVTTLMAASLHGRLEELRAATAVLREATERYLRILDPPSRLRNGTSGVTGVENPDGEPYRDDRDA